MSNVGHVVVWSDDYARLVGVFGPGERGEADRLLRLVREGGLRLVPLEGNGEEDAALLLLRAGTGCVVDRRTLNPLGLMALNVLETSLAGRLAGL